MSSGKLKTEIVCLKGETKNISPAKYIILKRYTPKIYVKIKNITIIYIFYCVTYSAVQRR